MPALQPRSRILLDNPIGKCMTNDRAEGAGDFIRMDLIKSPLLAFYTLLRPPSPLK